MNPYLEGIGCGSVAVNMQDFLYVHQSSHHKYKRKPSYFRKRDIYLKHLLPSLLKKNKLRIMLYLVWISDIFYTKLNDWKKHNLRYVLKCLYDSINNPLRIGQQFLNLAISEICLANKY